MSSNPARNSWEKGKSGRFRLNTVPSARGSPAQEGQILPAVRAASLIIIASFTLSASPPRLAIIFRSLMAHCSYHKTPTLQAVPYTMSHPSILIRKPDDHHVNIPSSQPVPRRSRCPTCLSANSALAQHTRSVLHTKISATATDIPFRGASVSHDPGAQVDQDLGVRRGSHQGYQQRKLGLECRWVRSLLSTRAPLQPALAPLHPALLSSPTRAPLLSNTRSSPLQPARLPDSFHRLRSLWSPTDIDQRDPGQRADPGFDRCLQQCWKLGIGRVV